MGEVIASNPYHYSFKLCAEQKQSTSKLATFNNKGKRNFAYDNYYNYDDPGTSKSDYHCDKCDRTLNNEKQYNDHVAEHVVCGLEGCQFTAHPKVVTNHVRMQHETGLYCKIKDLQKPEEIAKWIAERKRRYPTRQNIDFKSKLDERKEERGERIKPDNRRFNQDFKKKENSRKRFEQKRFKAQRQSKPRVRRPFPVPSEDEEDSDREIPRFSGTGSLYEKEESDEEPPKDTTHLSDDDYVAQDIPPQSKEWQTVNRSLGLLMASYGSDDSDDAPEEVKTISVKAENDAELPPSVQNKHHNVTVPREDSKAIKTDSTNSKRKQPVSDSKPRKRHRTKQDNRSVQRPEFIPKPKKPTLLEKLLSREIMHERNVLLQCIRYIVKNNFFEKNLTKSEDKESNPTSEL